MSYPPYVLPSIEPPHGSAAASQAGQIALKLQYQSLRRSAESLPALAEVEFSCYSQGGEDGILLYLLSIVGTGTRRSVEIGAGNAVESSTANLIVNHGWHGLLLDGDPVQAAVARVFFARCRTTWLRPPIVAAAWITTENVNTLVRAHGFAGEVDVLSVDVDGVDYWLWRVLDAVSPRVVVAEFNLLGGPEERLTVPYRPDFRRDLRRRPWHFGATLAAMTALAHDKGYRLVGVESHGANAFFVRAGLGDDALPERSPRECFEGAEILRRWEPAWLEAMRANGPWQVV